MSKATHIQPSGADILRQEYEAMGYELSPQELRKLMVEHIRSRQEHRGVMKIYADDKNNRRPTIKKKLGIGKITVEGLMHQSAIHYNGLYDEQRAKDRAAAAEFEDSIRADLADLSETPNRD